MFNFASTVTKTSKDYKRMLASQLVIMIIMRENMDVSCCLAFQVVVNSEESGTGYKRIFETFSLH